MLYKQRIRLLRDSWRGETGAERLSQELFTMFGPDVPLEHQGPITLDPNGIPFILRGINDGDTIFQILGDDGTQIGAINFSAGGFTPSASTTPAEDNNLVDIYGGSIVSGSGSTYQVDVGLTDPVTGDALPVSVTNVNENTGETIPAGAGVLVGRDSLGAYYMQAQTSQVFPGKIKGGTGTTYTVELYPNGLNGSVTNVTATQLNEPPSAIPADLWTFVGKSNNGTYWIDVPIPNAFPGEVVSGSGSSYQVNVWPWGKSHPSVEVSVTQLQIDASDTIPAGTAAIVTRTSDGNYYMQVPVWL